MGEEEGEGDGREEGMMAEMGFAAFGGSKK